MAAELTQKKLATQKKKKNNFAFVDDNQKNEQEKKKKCCQNPNLVLNQPDSSLRLWMYFLLIQKNGIFVLFSLG